MKPDKYKNYRLLGLTFSHDGTRSSIPWDGRDSNGVCRLGALSDDELAYQIEQGNAVEVREPREFKTIGRGYDGGGRLVIRGDRIPDWACDGDHEIIIREVLK